MVRLVSTVLLACWVGRPAPAAACTCIGLGPQEHFDRAELVFVGRAAKARRQGDRLLQPIRVLQALKGRPGKQVVLSREVGVINTCERGFEGRPVRALTGRAHRGRESTQRVSSRRASAAHNQPES